MKTLIQYIQSKTVKFESADLLDYLHARDNILSDIESYVKLLSSKPQIEMFAVPLEKPAYYEEYLEDEEWIFSIEGVGKSCKEYWEVSKSIIFSGWRIIVIDGGFIEIQNDKLGATLSFHSGKVSLEYGILEISDVETIEQLNKIFYNQL